MIGPRTLSFSLSVLDGGGFIQMLLSQRTVYPSLVAGSLAAIPPIR